MSVHTQMTRNFVQPGIPEALHKLVLVRDLSSLIGDLLLRSGKRDRQSRRSIVLISNACIRIKLVRAGALLQGDLSYWISSQRKKRVGGWRALMF